MISWKKRARNRLKSLLRVRNLFKNQDDKKLYIYTNGIIYTQVLRHLILVCLGIQCIH